MVQIPGIGEVALPAIIEENLLFLAGGILLIIILVLVFWYLKNKKNKVEGFPRVAHSQMREQQNQAVVNPPANPVQTLTPQTTTQSTAASNPTVALTTPKTDSVSESSPTVFSPQKPVPVPKKPASKPRRLRRFDRRGGNFESAQDSAREDDFAGLLDSSRSPSRSGSGREGDMDVLAQDVFEQSEREKKTQAELDELRKKLGLPGSATTPKPQAESAPPDRHHARWRDRRTGKESIPAKESHETATPPSNSSAQLEELKKMDFKDLLSDTEKKDGKSGEDELKELEGETAIDEDGPQPCPNCQKETDKVFFCPECGTGFCKNCASAFKKQGNDELYQCPNCQTFVKK